MFWDTLIHWGVKILASAGGIYVVAVSLIYVFQDKMTYVPRIPGFPSDYSQLPDSFSLGYEDVWLTTADGVKIHCWFMWPAAWTEQQRKERPVMLFFQENAGNLQMRLYFVRLIAHYLRCSIFAVSYRGYGPSEGKPSELGLKLDSQAALDHLDGREDIDGSTVFVYGRSLGGAVGLHLGASNPSKIKALIIENTFSTMINLAPHVAPFLKALVGVGKPCNWLVRNKWNNMAAAAQLKDMPILWLSSLQDEMLPPPQMKALYNVHPDNPKWAFHEFPDAHHMDIADVYGPSYWAILQHFVNDWVVNRSGATITNGVIPAAVDDGEKD